MINWLPYEYNTDINLITTLECNDINMVMDEEVSLRKEKKEKKPTLTLFRITVINFKKTKLVSKWKWKKN